MRVKKYIVDSMPDALRKIRVELGNDAVIINTKEIRIGGFLGFFSKKKIEVIAAIDENSAGAGKSKQLQRKETAASSVQFNASKILNQINTIAVLDEPLPFVPDVIVGNALPPIKEKLIVNAVVKDDTILKELRQMKEMMNKFANAQNRPEVRDPILKELEVQLLSQEIEPHLVQEIILQIEAELIESEEEISRKNVYTGAKQHLMEILKTDTLKNIAKDTKVVHFVGPTGVGKTTTIAKLAAEQVLKHHRKVGFITSDTYRIAAVEQLKTYATILNIPLEVVFSPQDLNKAFQQLQDRDVIFMDTAGRNFRNEMYVSELYSLMQNKGKSETFLVLSLTTKYKDMKVITDNFAKFNLDKVLFTKMDETDSYG